jgi:quercetin dioxygenase-like cupin family protein
MGVLVYDYRKDLRNVYVTSQLRCGFLRLEPGQVTAPHTHELGPDVVLVIEGRAVFKVDGQTRELGPGQLCVVLRGQLHSIRVVGDEPLIVFLALAPHIQPTHTWWTKDRKPMPHRFLPSSSYHIEADTSTPVGDLVERFVRAAKAVAKHAQASARVQQRVSAALKKALAEGDDEAAQKARNAMWDGLFPLFKKVYELADVWNTLAPRAAKTEQ